MVGAEAPKEPASVVRRSRRGTVEAGSLRSARESLERQQDRVSMGRQELRRQAVALFEALVGRLRTLSSLFALSSQDALDVTINRDTFGEAISALGVSATTEAVDAIFDEVDVLGTGRIDRELYLRYALQEGLSRSSALVVDFIRRQQQQQPDATGDDTRALDADVMGDAIRALGWEVPDQDVLSSLLERVRPRSLKGLNRLLQPGSALFWLTEVATRPAMPRTKNVFAIRRNSLEEQMIESLERAERRSKEKRRSKELPALAEEEQPSLPNRSQRASKELPHRSPRSSKELVDVPPEHLLQLLKAPRGPAPPRGPRGEAGGDGGVSVVRRSRRISVQAGSLRSARASVERAAEREVVEQHIRPELLGALPVKALSARESRRSKELPAIAASAATMESPRWRGGNPLIERSLWDEQRDAAAYAYELHATPAQYSQRARQQMRIQPALLGPPTSLLQPSELTQDLERHPLWTRFVLDDPLDNRARPGKPTRSRVASHDFEVVTGTVSAKLI